MGQYNRSHSCQPCNCSWKWPISNELPWYPAPICKEKKTTVSYFDGYLSVSHTSINIINGRILNLDSRHFAGGITPLHFLEITNRSAKSTCKLRVEFNPMHFSIVKWHSIWVIVAVDNAKIKQCALATFQDGKSHNNKSTFHEQSYRHFLKLWPVKFERKCFVTEIGQ